jgi:hypothetical protein
MTSKVKKNDGTKITLDVAQVKSVLMEQPDFLQPVVQAAVQSILEVEMAECLQAGKHERREERLGYRSGYYRRRLITRVGTLVLRVPQDRAGQFSTQVFEQYQRSEKALVASLAQMYVQGVSTRKVAAIAIRAPRFTSWPHHDPKTNLLNLTHTTGFGHAVFHLSHHASALIVFQRN